MPNLLTEATASCALDGDTQCCMLCEGYARRIAEIRDALFDAATRFRSAAEQLWTNGKNSEDDALATALIEAGRAAYETAKGSGD